MFPGKGSYAENYSYNSAATMLGGGAKDEEPDILVNHVATVNLGRLGLGVGVGL